MKEGLNVPGNAESPLTWDDIGSKFAECAKASVNPLDDEKIMRAIELARTLASLPDATLLMSALR